MKKYLTIVFLFLFFWNFQFSAAQGLTPEELKQSIAEAIAARDYARADSLIEGIPADLQQDISIWFYKSKVLLWQEKYKEAERLLKQIIVRNPLHKEAYNELGYITYLKIKGKKTATPSVKNYWIKIFKERKAINYLKKALEIDSTYTEAKRNLALVYQNSLEKSKIEEASKILSRLQESEAENAEDLYILGTMEYDLSHWTKAQQNFLKALTINPRFDLPCYKLSQIYFRKGDIDFGTRYYYLALENLQDPDLINDLFWDFKIIATEQEVQEYDAAPSKGDYLLKYWQNKDPTPTTLQNEFLQEFYHRIYLAKEKFPSAAYRGYDDRGVILIRYGPPDEKMSDLSVKQNISWDSETWVYRRIAPQDVIFDFIRIGTDYFLVDNLSEALRVGQQSPQNLMELLEKRTHLSPVYSKYLARFELIYTRNFTENVFSNDISAMDSRAATILTDMDRELELARKNAPKTFFELPQARLNVALASANFKAGKKIQHEIYLGVPYSELSFHPISDDSLQSALEITLNIKDNDFRTLNNFTLNRTITVDRDVDLKRMYYLDELVSRLSPGKYHIGVVIKNPDSKKQFIQRYHLSLVPYPTDDLVLSDVEISPRIHSQPYPVELEDWLKDNYIITPYPFYDIQKQKPFYVYFEIYNLTMNEDEEVRYTVEYTVEQAEGKKDLGGFLAGLNPFGGGKKASLTVKNERVEKQRNVAEYLAMDFSKLKDGNYILKISVTDLNNPGRTATTTQPLTIRH